MQDRYVGDIGDFANNGLLRYLCGVTGPKVGRPLRLGLVWYLNEPTESELSKSPSAGNKIGYLNFSGPNDSMYRDCDRELYDTLQRLVGESLVNRTPRSIRQIEKARILPQSALYYSVSLNATDRDEWLRGALQKTMAADLIFVNPDIGIASDRQARSPAHATMDEMRRFALRNRGKKSLIIYQHLGQGKGTAEERIDDISERLQNGLQPTRPPWVLRWRRESGRAYFIVPLTKEHELLLSIKIMTFLNRSIWREKGNFTKA